MCHQNIVQATDCGHTITKLSMCHAKQRNARKPGFFKKLFGSKPSQRKTCPPEETTTRIFASQDRVCDQCRAIPVEELAQVIRNHAHEKRGLKKVVNMINFHNRTLGPLETWKFKNSVYRIGDASHPLSYNEARALFWCLRCRRNNINRPEVGKTRSPINGLCCDHSETFEEFKELVAKKSISGYPVSPPGSRRSSLQSYRSVRTTGLRDPNSSRAYIAGSSVRPPPPAPAFDAYQRDNAPHALTTSGDWAIVTDGNSPYHSRHDQRIREAGSSRRPVAPAPAPEPTQRDPIFRGSLVPEVRGASGRRGAVSHSNPAQAPAQAGPSNGNAGGLSRQERTIRSQAPNPGGSTDERLQHRLAKAETQWRKILRAQRMGHSISYEEELRLCIFLSVPGTKASWLAAARGSNMTRQLALDTKSTGTYNKPPRLDNRGSQDTALTGPRNPERYNEIYWIHELAAKQSRKDRQIQTRTPESDTLLTQASHREVLDNLWPYEREYFFLESNRRELRKGR
ncbi:hypothetical protein HYALB_00005632 [Hymenoscyphus albidus]|uniref:Uncharacterized protein n=1 Tax=Hymenoscyphus albidus TaxID=595503 RepID=A0A9N9LNI0_9HELO|nr:hypothetical protein HYALB_00005632 [Hymenoscyphus albidus]